MHVGMSAFFQNLTGQETDREVYAQAVAMAEMAEPLGFESVWTAEHHFDNYTMCPSVTQFLTYMAGRTKNVQLGSMVMVLPWHDPVRVAEEFSVLDHLSGGRAILGIGRGLGRIEFEGFRVDMNESRERFVEYADAILGALESGYIEYDGVHYKQPRKQIRPFPFKTYQGRVYAAAVSPASAEIMARLKIGLLIIAQKPWDKTLQELETYRGIYREVNGCEAPKPIVVSFIACHEDPEEANRMHREYLRGYSRSALNHYEFDNAGLAEIKGYEYYGGLARNIVKHGVDTFVNFLADLKVYGTPEKCLEIALEHQKMADSAGLVGVFHCGGMPFELAKHSMTLFAEKVMPELQALDVGETIGGTGAPTPVADRMTA